MKKFGKEIVRNLYLSHWQYLASLVVESCFDSNSRGDFLLDDSGVKVAPFLFRYFFRQGDNLVDDSGVKGAPFLFRYFLGSFDYFLLYPIMSRRSRAFNQFLMSVIIIIFVLFLYPAILK